MSEATKPKAPRKPRAPKSTTGSTQEPVAQSADTEPTQAEQDALKVEAEKAAEVDAKATTEATTQADESSSEKPEVVESDEQEPSATTADSKQDKKGSDEDGQVDSTQATDGDSGDDALVLGVLGAFTVRAKSDRGFWRCGVQFLRAKETVVLVVDQEPESQPEIVAQEGVEPELILFMPKEKAERIHREPNLIVTDVELSDVIDIKDA